MYFLPHDFVVEKLGIRPLPLTRGASVRRAPLKLGKTIGQLIKKSRGGCQKNIHPFSTGYPGPAEDGILVPELTGGERDGTTALSAPG
jgi:hypothetical protein